MWFVNVTIALVLLLYAFYGYRRGFVVQTVELISFIVSFGLSLALYRTLSEAVAPLVTVPPGIVGLLVFLGLWLVWQLIFTAAWKRLRNLVPSQIANRATDRLVGILPALFKGSFLVGIVLLIVSAAPLPTAAKQPVLQADLAKPFVALGAGWQNQFNDVFGTALKDTLALKSVKTGNNDSVPLGFTTTTGTEAPEAEQAMLDLVNLERSRAGLQPVVFDEALREVARAHSRDMLARGYFAHVTPDGVDPFQRMARVGIEYEYAGENLALGPNVEVAHEGLMNSPGHRANILKPEFRKLGIGCIDAGLRGKMFSQEFTG